MKRKRYSEEQIAFALRQHESGTAVAEIVRKMGITEQTFYRRKKKYSGLGVAEVRAFCHDNPDSFARALAQRYRVCRDKPHSSQPGCLP